jgi:hypothetical protein
MMSRKSPSSRLHPCPNLELDELLAESLCGHNLRVSVMVGILTLPPYSLVQCGVDHHRHFEHMKELLDL